MRLQEHTVTFAFPFTVSGLDGPQPAGSYTVLTEEELLESLSFKAYRRVGTNILIPLDPRFPNSVQSVSIDPRELEASLLRDRAISETGAIAG